MLNKTIFSALVFFFCYETCTCLQAEAFSQNLSGKPEAIHSKKLSNHENSQAEMASLLTYLNTPSFPKAVKNLFEKARENYKTTFDFQWSQMVAWDAAGGGRPDDWIKKIFSQEEDEIVETLQKIPAPKTWSIGSIHQTYTQILGPNETEQKEQIILVEGVGVNGIHQKNSLVQLASQFNYLESPGPYKVPVSKYLYDLTQGPLGSIEATAAALHRLASEKSGKLLNALHSLLPPEALPFYKHGYLMLVDAPENLCKEIYEHMVARIDRLEILPQWVLCEASGSIQMQIFSAAPSFQGRQSPDPGSWAEKIAILLVSKQYEALGKIAVIRSLLTGSTVCK